MRFLFIIIMLVSISHANKNSISFLLCERVIYSTNSYYTLLKITKDRESMTYGVLMDEMLIGLCYLHVLKDKELPEHLRNYRSNVSKKICMSIIQNEFGKNTPNKNMIIYTPIYSEQKEIQIEDSKSDKDLAMKIYEAMGGKSFILRDLIESELSE